MSDNKNRFLKALFLQEEFQGDKNINTLRFYLALVLLILALVKANVFHGFVISPSLIVTLIAISVALGYTGILFFLYRKSLYHPVIKFISMTIDITLVVGSIYAYKLDTVAEYATIFFLARLAVIYIFIFLSILRYNFTLSLYAGALAGLEYLLFVILGNDFLGKTFMFVGKDGALHYSSFLSSEMNLRIVYFILSGLTAAFIANNVKKLVVKSLKQQQEKNALETKTKVQEAVTSEYQKLTDNITDALIMIDENFTIGSQFSKKAVELFETNTIADMNFVDLIYPDETQIEAKKELSHFLSVLWKNKVTEMDMLMDINPLNKLTLDIQGKRKIIKASFGKIYEDDKLVNILITIQDVTELEMAAQQLAKEKEKHQVELENISAILKMGTDSLADFLNEAYEALSVAKDNLNDLTEDNINKIFRFMHSLKGVAHTIGFYDIAKKAHALEDLFAAIRDKGEADLNEIRSVQKNLENLTILIDDIVVLKNRFSSFRGSSSKTDYRSSLKAELEKMAFDLTEQFEKPSEISINIDIDDEQILKNVKNSLIHLLRNSIDHGIEDKFERLSVSKSEKAKLILEAYKKDNFYFFEISDDGKGIDLEKVKKKGIKKGLLKTMEPSRNELLNLLFNPGFSSKDIVTEISGRGVGLDVVKTSVDNMKGKIQIATEKNKGTKFILKIPA